MTGLKRCFLIMIPLFFSCAQEEKSPDHIQVKSRTILKNLPSASGIEILNDRIFVISDNTLWLYELNNQFQILDTFLIAPTEDEQGHIFSKETKFDFEGIAAFQLENENHFLIFGSGSKSYERNKLVWLRFKDSIVSEVHDLSAFYAYLQKNARLNKKNFNLEGMCVLEDQLYLFNRGNNAIWRFKLADFLDFLRNDAAFPLFEQFHIVLPKFQEVQAGFSGASELKEEGKIIFTASLEDTENWIDDGEVLGSYLGLIDVRELRENYEPAYFPLLSEGEMLRLKVESSAVRKKTEDVYHMLLVTDSDGGNSELLEIELNFRP